jgi:hypothetical protein
MAIVIPLLTGFPGRRGADLAQVPLAAEVRVVGGHRGLDTTVEFDELEVRLPGQAPQHGCLGTGRDIHQLQPLPPQRPRAACAGVTQQALHHRVRQAGAGHQQQSAGRMLARHLRGLALCAGGSAGQAAQQRQQGQQSTG